MRKRRPNIKWFPPAVGAAFGLFLAVPAGAVEVTTITLNAVLPEQAASVSEAIVDGQTVSVAADRSFSAEVAISAGATSAGFEVSWTDGTKTYSRTIDVTLEDLPEPITGLDVSKSELEAFLGGKSGILTWVDAGKQVQVLDFRGATPTVQPLSGAASAINPLISPDGTRVVYSVGSANGPKFIHVQSLSGGASTQIATGDIGYWYVDGTGEYIIYADWSDKTQNGADGNTYKQKIVTNGTTTDGAVTTIHDRAMDGGVNADGRWLGQVYNQMFTYDLGNTTEYDTSQFFLMDGAVANHQTCNGSMAPDATSQLMLLVIPHDWVRIFSHDSTTGRFNETSRFNLPPVMTEWEFPDWSSDVRYFTAVLRSGGFNFRLYVAKVADGELVPEVLPVTTWDESVSYNNLWVAP